MLEYFALVWSPTAGEAAGALIRRCQALHTRFAVVCQANGLTVLCSGTDHCPLGSHGVLLGTLFRRGKELACGERFEPAAVSESDACRMVSDPGQTLISEYWGNYVAVLHDPCSGDVSILRGPASSLPCFHLASECIDIYFSSMELCAQITARHFSIDWQHLARTLLAPRADGITDVRDVTEILPGHIERLRCGRRDHAVLWDPCSISLQPQLDDWTQASQALRDVTRACVSAWAAPFDCVLHALSGGLDSSVTLACLVETPVRVVCLTQYGDDPDSDERPFARLAARHVDCELIEHRRDENVDFATACYSVRLAHCPSLRLAGVDRVQQDAARQRGAKAIFRGDGGDELFCRTQLGLYVMDFVRERGFGSGFTGLLVHAAAAEGITAWPLLLRAVSSRFSRPRIGFAELMARDIERATLLKREVVRELISQEAGARIQTESPGHAWQASLLKAPRTFTGPFSRADDPPDIAPLLSQPLIELCLRIPTYFQMRGRKDRALARAAFATDLPREIVERRDKGDAEQLAKAMLSRNLEFARELLLDGIVAKQGFVDRTRLEATLAMCPSVDAVPSVPLFGILGAEVWARAWCASHLSPGR